MRERSSLSPGTRSPRPEFVCMLWYMHPNVSKRCPDFRSMREGAILPNCRSSSVHIARQCTHMPVLCSDALLYLYRLWLEVKDQAKEAVPSPPQCQSNAHRSSCHLRQTPDRETDWPRQENKTCRERDRKGRRKKERRDCRYIKNNWHIQFNG